MLMYKLTVIILSLLCNTFPHPVNTEADLLEDEETEYSNDFLVEISGGERVARSIADQYGFRIEDQFHLDEYGDVYHFVHDEIEKRTKRAADKHRDLLLSHLQVNHVEQQVHLIRDKRDFTPKELEEVLVATIKREAIDNTHSDIEKRRIDLEKEKLTARKDRETEEDTRDIVYDKQNELEIETYKDRSVFERHYTEENDMAFKDGIPSPDTEDDMNFIDPLYRDQWQLHNSQIAGGKKGMNLNVVAAWKKGFTGKGTVVCILDDGVQHEHPDLKKNYDPEASSDFNGNDDDPTPRDDVSNSHGTRCAGEIASEANNSFCGVGIAFDAKIGGVRLLDGKVTDKLEAKAAIFKMTYVDIYSASWGPRDNGKVMEKPGRYTQAALKEGTSKGRHGRGNIYVWATGNGGHMGDDCGADGYVSSIYTLSVGSINQYGLSTYFMEFCPSTLAVVYSGGKHDPKDRHEREHPILKVVTTDIDGGCTENFQGTSSAAPLCAGCVALALQANQNMTWRDVQHLVVETARIPNFKEPGWEVNGAGKHTNEKFGFGVLDCGKMVEVAQTWKNVGPQHTCVSPMQKENKKIDSKSTISMTMSTSACQNTENRIDHLEHVEVYVRLNTSRRGDIQLTLISPAGTRSELLSLRPYDDSKKGIDFTFMTVRNWGENPRGTWTLVVKDIPLNGRENTGEITYWQLILHGTDAKAERGRSARPHKDEDEMQSAFVPDPQTVKNMMEKEEAESKEVVIKKLTQAVTNALPSYDSEYLQKEIREIIGAILDKTIPKANVKDVLQDLVEDLQLYIANRDKENRGGQKSKDNLRQAVGEVEESLNPAKIQDGKLANARRLVAGEDAMLQSNKEDHSYNSFHKTDRQEDTDNIRTMFKKKYGLSDDDIDMLEKLAKRMFSA
ncbi:neuroendocrine convertase 2-like [Lingula anatina]|uniref:Neuroendocrine convertase 2-like n=1 Tax=Lingula anatina TaxID=7574 RepID=A0A1S3HG99_LINAN|nr:neuroendocrine convertase 2-like [Lingula anatina]XP_013385104.1 neuroendocrine convertase 2-like [Lingula anatina]XP_013385105.1 neuroendocrine convertase 2-like [Lingula anatina]XP_013385106.1 neuroendocrine convertase 2-like [Lingula anatina]|eukprot:XP_013385103.1 neuroendocrine convertase 2-like [Lingula anatina]